MIVQQIVDKSIPIILAISITPLFTSVNINVKFKNGIKDKPKEVLVFIKNAIILGKKDKNVKGVNAL